MAKLTTAGTGSTPLKLAATITKMIGLAAILDIASAGDRIFMTSLGSGAGSDAFSFNVTDRLDGIRSGAPSVSDLLADKEYVNYATYARHKGKIRL